MAAADASASTIVLVAWAVAVTTKLLALIVDCKRKVSPVMRAWELS